MKSKDLRIVKNTGFVVGLMVGTLTAVGTAFVYVSTTSNDQPNRNIRSNDVPNVHLEQPKTQSTEVHIRKAVHTVEGIDRILQSTSNFDRPLVLEELLVDVDVVQLSAMLVQCEQLSTESTKDAIQIAIVRRLALSNPNDALEQVERRSENGRKSLVKTVFEEWAVSDLSGAVERARRLDKSYRKVALKAILESRTNLSDDKLLEIGRWLGDEQLSIDHVANSKIGSYMVDPRETWYALLANYGADVTGLSDSQLRLISYVAFTIVDRDGADGLQAILVSMSHEDSRMMVVEQVLESIAVDNPQTAMDLALSVNNLDRALLEKVIQSFARTNPSVALDVAFSVDQGGNRMQRSAIEAWAAVEPDSLYAELDDIPQELREWGLECALLSMAQESPQSVGALLGSLEYAPFKYRVAKSLAKNWSNSDPKSALAWSKSWFKSNPNPRVQEQQWELQSTIVKNVAQTHPSLAMNIAQAEEITGNEIGLEAEVISEMARINMNEAMIMLDRARNQATREAAYSAIGRGLVLKGRTDEALGLVQNSSTEFQREYFMSIAYAWAESDFEDLFRNWDKLPSDTAVLRNVSIALASAHHRLHISLSPEQKGIVRRNLPKMLNIYLD